MRDLSHEKIHLLRRRQVWQQKAVLRAVYRDWCCFIAQYRAQVNGVTVEVGSGMGNLKTFLSDVYSSDLLYSSWLDLNFDALQLPFKETSLSNLIGIDVLHHLESPISFISEAERCLKKGGRVILIEPYLTPISSFFWRFHCEPIDFKVDLFHPNHNGDKPKASENVWKVANQAIPTLFFKNELKKFLVRFRHLRLVERKPFSYLGYPLTCGFRKMQLVPSFLYPFLMAQERRLDPLAEWIAFRILVVLERV